MFNLFTPRVFNSGYLPEKEGHRIYFMELGNPDGKPVLIFHGGPGSCSKAYRAAAFDRKKYRVIMFDQRGCGRSMPAGEMENNDSIAALEDAERLIKYLNIKKPLIVRGGSWGSTLALLFAMRNPNTVEKLLLSLTIKNGWKKAMVFSIPICSKNLKPRLPKTKNLIWHNVLPK